jgi:hypothetical protein
MSDLKLNIRPVDIQVVAEITGFTSDYVRRVIAGTRKNPAIIEAAEKVVENRRQLIDALKEYNFNNPKNKTLN